MTPATLAHPGNVLRSQLRPSREQLRVAKAMFSAAPEDVTSVVVPIVVAADEPHSEHTTTEHPGGYWLADRGSPDGAYSYRAARDAAEAAAKAYLRRHGGRGVPGWINIRPNGTWAVFDGLAA